MHLSLIPKRFTSCLLALVLGLAHTPSASASDQPGYVPTAALRVMDTRTDEGGPTFGAEESRRLSLMSMVPRGAIAVELNITALDATDTTHLTVWPAGRVRPYTSNLIVGEGDVRSNTAIVELGRFYSVDMYNESGDVDVIVDVIGWFTGDFESYRPMRMVDTRYGFGAKTVEANLDQDVIIGGRFGIPADVTAVAMNVTAIGATEPTSILMWPAGTPKPLVGMVSVPSSAIHGQSAIVGLGYGMFSLSATNGRAEVIVDITGWFRADGRFVAVPARRIVDTKAGVCGIEFGPGETRTFPVTDAPDVFAVALNIRASDASENTFLTVWGAGAPPTATSNLNVMPGPNPVGTVVITELGPGGQISLFNAAGTVHVTVDVIGTVGGVTPTGDRTPCPMPPVVEPDVSAPTTTKPPVSWQTSMINAVNRERKAVGLAPVSACGTLNLTAQAYSQVLVGTGSLSHTGPDGSTLPTRAAASGYVGWSNLGENLAAGQGTVEAAMTDWMNSEGHRANILKPEFTHLGIGRTKGILQGNTTESWFWVQVFGSGGIC